MNETQLGSNLRPQTGLGFGFGLGFQFRSHIPPTERACEYLFLDLLDFSSHFFNCLQI